MKLEIKHLAPYLPYGLNIEILNYKCDYVGIKYSKANGFYFIGDSLHLTYNGGSAGKDIESFKPILSQMSDLPDDIFVDFGFADEEDFLICLREGRLNYCDIVKLISQKFDVFGLIDAGLAIDINTVPELLNG